MSSSLQQSSRSLFSCLKPARRRPTRQCSQPQRFLQKQQRCLSSFTPQLDQQQQDGSIRGSSTSTEPGRWSRTPPAMAAPIRAKPYPPNYKPFPVNKSPDKLDAMYAAFLGKNGSKMLSDETKWLAVTHKSFDHGRRGFNDRLAFLGSHALSNRRREILVLTKEQGSGYWSCSARWDYSRLRRERCWRRRPRRYVPMSTEDNRSLTLHWPMWRC